MRRSLLNKRILPKPLRQALVLITLLLLPSAAWGQDITVAGNSPDQSGNITGTGITGTVTYSDGTLTLNGATIGGSIIYNGSDPLKIYLLEENKIQGVDYQNELEFGIKSSSSVKLTFTTDETTPGNLFFPNVTTPIEGFTDIVYNNGLEWGCDSYTESSKICTNFYKGVGTNVVIAAVSWQDCITKTNLTITTNGGGNIVYRNSDGKNILKLSGITDYNTSINWYSPDDVTIEIDGDNSFVFDSNSPKIIGNSQSNISFTSTSTSTSATLRFWHKGTGIDFVNLDVPFISGFKNAGNPNLGAGLYHVDLIDTRKDNGSNTDFTEHYITTKAYDLTVKGVRVHDIDGVFKGHKDHIMGEDNNTVKFTPADKSQPPTPATLTLDNATLGQSGDGHNEIVSGLSSLNVYLKGVNVINCANEDKYIFEGGGSSTSLTFSTDPDNPGTLTMSSGKSGFGTTSFYTNFNEESPEYDEQLQAIVDNDNNVIISWAEPLGLTIAGVVVTSLNANNIKGDNIDVGSDGKVSFNPNSTPAKLELKNAKITGAGGIFWGNSEELCIEITGYNSVENLVDGYMSYAIGTENDANLTIKAADGADATLKLSNYVENSQITSYTDIERFTTNFSPLKKYPNTTPVKEGSYYYSYYTTYDVYDLWIGGTQVHAIPDLSLGYKDDVRGDGSVKFTPASGGTSGTLTLENAKNNIGEIISGLSSLTIHVIGENTTGYIQTDPNATAGTLTLEKENASSILAIEKESSISSFIFGFTSFTNNDFTLFGFDSESSSPSALSGSFTYSSNSLGWSGSGTPSKMVACILFEGEGTESIPYKIQSPGDLAKFATYVNKGIITNQHFKLTTNIDCKDLDGFESIGNHSSFSPFTGTLNGDGNTISNLTISSGLGFFGYISGGTVEYLNFFRLSVTGGNNHATGGIASELSDGGKIDDCTLTECTIACSNNQYSPEVGGIVARLSGSESAISNCVVYKSTINASTTYTGGSGSHAYAAGIAASSSSGTITNCHVKDGSKIINLNADGSSELKTGAIVGNLSSETTLTSLTSNIYYYDVTVETQLGNSNKETKSEYTHRGTGSANYDAYSNNSSSSVKDPEGIAMYTKKVTIPLVNESNNPELVYYYSSTTSEGNIIYNVAPDVETDMFVLNYAIKGSYTVNGETKTIEPQPKEGETETYSFTMPDADVTFTIQKAAEVWMHEGQVYGTYYNATEDMAVPMGMTAYMVTGISEDGTKVTMTRVSYIKAGVAVLIENGNDGTEISQTTDFSGSKMAYSDPDTPAKPSATDKWYVIYNNKFVKVTTGTEVSGGKCYLNLNGTSSSGTRSYYDIDGSDGTTGIREVKSEGVKGEKLADGAWHDLQGRKFTTKPTKPGLYILNGKKVVIK